MTSPNPNSKMCVACGTDCANQPRMKDTRGRYFCKPCYARAVKTASATAKSGGTVVTAAPVARASAKVSDPVHQHQQKKPSKYLDGEEQGEYGLEATAPVVRPISPQAISASGIQSEIITCPSCTATLQAGSIICIPCGINAKTGRSIVTAEQGDTSRTYANAESLLWIASWPTILGLIPISSEAHGIHKPWAIRIIAITTVLVSMLMWTFEWTGSNQMRTLKNQFLWAGDAKPDLEHISMFYQLSSFGDEKAFERKMFELSGTVPAEDLPSAALKALPKSQRAIGEFHWWQLITHAFLHGGILHLGGNLLFLLIFGSRINALIGQVGIIVLYPLLAVISGLAQMASMANQMPTMALGASGAISGLAGMYLVFFATAPVHVAGYLRIVLWFRMIVFKCRGFWILLFFTAFDVLYIVLGAETGVAHWAHLGGFIAGMTIAVTLMVTRGVNPHGSDLFSAVLGRFAWPIIGKPSQWRDVPSGEGWLSRFRIIPEGALQSTLGRA